MDEPDYTAEQWRVIPDFPAYAVSNMGRIKRVKTAAKGGPGYVGRILKAYDTGGYARIWLQQNGKEVRQSVHRIVCAVFHGPAPDGLPFVCHKDDNRANNAADNLYWGSPADNTRDSFRNGKAPTGDRHWTRAKPHIVKRGEDRPQAKLTEAQARNLYADRRSLREVAAAFGVTEATVSAIRSKRIWKHIHTDGA